MSWTPCGSGASPRSTLRNGTTCFRSHRNWAEGGRRSRAPSSARTGSPPGCGCRRSGAGDHSRTHRRGRGRTSRSSCVVSVLVDPVVAQRLGRASTALVQCREEASRTDLLELLGVHGAIHKNDSDSLRSGGGRCAVLLHAKPACRRRGRRQLACCSTTRRRMACAAACTACQPCWPPGVGWLPASSPGAGACPAARRRITSRRRRSCTAALRPTGRRTGRRRRRRGSRTASR